MNREKVGLTGEQTVRFESAGPEPSQVVERLRREPPAALAEHPIDRVLQPVDDSEIVVLEAAGVRMTIIADDDAAELRLLAEAVHSTSEADGGGHIVGDTQVNAMLLNAMLLNAMLQALVSLVADPERADTYTRLVAASAFDDTMIDERAAALFASEPQSLSRKDALLLAVRSIDLTTLNGDDTPGRVRALCAQARLPDPANAAVGPVAAVCVYPNLVGIAVDLTNRSDVVVASVAGAFPSGLSSLHVRLSDITDALDAGADEIDVVLNRSAFLAGDHDLVTREIAAMRERVGTRVMKVILETGELDAPPLIRAAAQLAIDAGADWIKTSTGKSNSGATPAAVLAMAEAIGEHDSRRGTAVGLKISGGVRTAADALGYLSILEATLGPAWLDPTRVRFGASGLLDNLVAELAR